METRNTTDRREGWGKDKPEKEEAFIPITLHVLHQEWKLWEGGYNLTQLFILFGNAGSTTQNTKIKELLAFAS